MTARTRTTLIVAATLAVALFLVAGWMRRAAPAAAGPKPNVIMVVVDTLRADRLGSYGNRRGLTPFLDELAARGSVFTHAYASSSWTCPSVASLFTSRYPTQHRVTGFSSPLVAEERTLAEALDDGGYRNAGFTANFRLTPELGYAQGFGFWGAYVPDVSKGEVAAKIRGGRLRQEAESYINGSRVLAVNEPYFLYFQLMETHAPYRPPAPFRDRFAPPGEIDDDAAMTKLLMPVIGLKGLSSRQLARMMQLYDGEVASADEELRQLFASLDALGLLRDAVVVITADHGEEFGEHGQLLHGITLYEPAIRVPLLIVGPQVAADRVVSEPVSLLDVAPTVLELAGLPGEGTFDGRSLVSLLRGEETQLPAPHGIVSELERVAPKGIEMRMHQRALSDGQHKALVTPWGGLEVYDLGADPGERDPLAGAAATQVAGALAPLSAEYTAIASRPAAAPAPESVVLDDATKEKLRALGYHE